MAILSKINKQLILIKQVECFYIFIILLKAYILFEAILLENFKFIACFREEAG